MGISISKRKVLLGGILLLIIIAAIVIAVVCFSQKDDDKVSYREVTVSKVNMKQTLTSAGKITAGKSETVTLVKNKKFKGAAVEENQLVSKGQALVYYTDGTHTYAPADGVVTSVTVPKSGEKTTSGHSVRLKHTEEMYMKITVPQEEISKISKGSEAVVVVNALNRKEFPGTITEKLDVPNSFFESSEEGDEGGADEDMSEDGESLEEVEDGEMIEDDDDDVFEELGESSGEEESEGEGTAQYTITMKFQNDGRVRPGMSAGCVITISDRSEVTALPVQAVFFDEDKAYVEKVTGKNKVEKVFVETGQSDALYVEIVSGLNSGDKVRMAVNGEEGDK